jgi:hypothetical protein
MKRIALVALFVLLPAQARSDAWTTTDTVVEAGCIALLLIDWRQTLDRRYQESNPILGSHPSRAAVDGYFMGVIVAQLLVARLLPSRWRSVFQGVTIGIEGRSVVNNWLLGASLVW